MFWVPYFENPSALIKLLHAYTLWLLEGWSLITKIHTCRGWSFIKGTVFRLLLKGSQRDFGISHSWRQLHSLGSLDG